MRMSIGMAKSNLVKVLSSTPNASKIADAVNKLIKAHVDDAVAALKQEINKKAPLS
jgi:hypothetical protein